MQNTDDTPEIIDTEEREIDENFDDDAPEDDILTMTGTQFAVGYLLRDSEFAEWYFRRNRWDAVEQEYDRLRKK